MGRSAIRVRSSALLNTPLLRRSSPWGGSSEKAEPATARGAAPRDVHDLLAQALDGPGNQGGFLLMVESALASLEGQRAAHVPPPTNPRSAHLLVPRALAAPPLASADPLPSSRAGS